MPFCVAWRFAWPFADLPQSVFASASVSARGRIFTGLTGVLSRRFWARLFPKPIGSRKGVDLQILPPCHFITGLMDLPMMAAAEWYGELIADFEAQGSGLRKPQVMRIGRLPAADEAGL